MDPDKFGDPKRKRFHVADPSGRLSGQSYSALAIPMQITIENWKKKTGADLVYVPVRGGGDMVNGLLTGTTPVAIVGLPNFIPYIRSGTVKARLPSIRRRARRCSPMCRL